MLINRIFEVLLWDVCIFHRMILLLLEGMVLSWSIGSQCGRLLSLSKIHWEFVALLFPDSCYQKTRWRSQPIVKFTCVTISHWIWEMNISHLGSPIPMSPNGSL